MSRPKVTCFCDTDLVHSAHAVAGLIDLSHAGEIELDFRWRDPRLQKPQGHWTLWLRVRGDGDEVGACVDCHDSDRYLCFDSLVQCKYYFKSNLTDASRRLAPLEAQNRLRPYGPYLPSRSVHDFAMLKRLGGSIFTKLRHRFFVSTSQQPFYQNMRSVGFELLRGRRYKSRKTTVGYEHSPIESLNGPGVILFNPTCWDEMSRPEIAETNEFRASLIKELKKEFGPRFVGGFRRTGTCYSRYPGALEDRVLSHDEYVSALFKSNLSVYTNGLLGCFSWRFAELVASSKCIVSELIPNDAGVVLDERVGVFQEPTVARMMEKLVRLDKDWEMTLDCARRSQRYYREYVQPAACMRRIIRQLCGPTS